MTQGNLIKEAGAGWERNWRYNNQGQRRKPHDPIPLQLLWPKNCQDCHARRNKPHHLLHQLPDGGINKWRMSLTRILVHKLGCVTGTGNNEEG
jgi:hypothetical protein